MFSTPSQQGILSLTDSVEESKKTTIIFFVIIVDFQTGPTTDVTLDQTTNSPELPENVSSSNAKTECVIGEGKIDGMILQRRP